LFLISQQTKVHPTLRFVHMFCSSLWYNPQKSL